MQRGKFHSVVNILGLSLGMAVILLIGGYAFRELSVNRGLKDIERTFVIQSRWTPQNMGVFYTTLGPLALTLKEQYPMLVEDAYRYTIVSTIMSTRQGQSFKEQLQVGDSSMVSMFGFELLHGDIKAVFKPHGIVVTETIAKKYFGKTNVIGEVLTIQTNGGKQIDHEVMGVLKDMDMNSVVNFSGNPGSLNQIFVSMSSIKYFMNGVDSDWAFKYMVSIIKLREGIVPSDLDGPTKKIIASNAPQEYSNSLVCELKPLRDYYLSWGNGKALKMVRILSAVAIFLLLMVIANFVNITVSDSSYRLREIGLRKLFGGLRRALIFQFIFESVVIGLVAMIFSLIVYIVLHPVFQQLLDKRLPEITEFSFPVFIGLVLFSVLVGCLAGIYPAVRLSGFKIVSAVRGKLPASGEGTLTRRVLLCFQITTVSFVLLCAVIMGSQLEFVRGFDLGYEHEDVLVVSSVPRQWNAEGIARMETVRNDLLSDGTIASASISYEVPDGNAGNRFNFRSGDQYVDMPLLEVDEHFRETYNLKMLEGRFFYETGGVYDSNKVVLNFAAVRSFGWTPEIAIGNQLTFGGTVDPLTVVGVVDNFHFGSLFEPVTPIAIRHIRDRGVYRYISLRTNSDRSSEVVERLEARWKDIFPGAPFEYVFMEDRLAQFYSVENRLFRTSKIAGILTILITVSGIIAFMSVSLAKRTKEIGIRRIHGASTKRLIWMLIKDFAWEYLIGAMLASIMAIYFLNNWLTSFQYRIDLPPQSFVLVQLSIFILISILTATYSLRTIMKNPVTTLRSE
jgi:putative ABC transport system permease protein